MSFIRKATRAKHTSSRFPIKEKETLTAARTITGKEIQRYQGFVFDPGGTARTVTLPAEAAADDMILMIANEADAAEDITVKEDAGSTTIVTISQNERALLWCDGVTWYGFVGAKT